MVDYTDKTTSNPDETQITMDIRGKNAAEFANIWLRNHPYGNIVLTGWSSYPLATADAKLHNLALRAGAKLTYFCNTFILESK
jgi:hypothetical protein